MEELKKRFHIRIWRANSIGMCKICTVINFTHNSFCTDSIDELMPSPEFLKCSATYENLDVLESISLCSFTLSGTYSGKFARYMSGCKHREFLSKHLKCYEMVFII